MKKPDRSNYTPIDFLQWRETGTLEISPKFQRRGVWKPAAQSYFIDTLLLGLPVPPIYLRVVQDEKKRGVIREVIDGQQRITAVLSFAADEFALAKNIESECVGKRFSQLTKEQQDAILQYSFICEVFYGAADREVLKIFARLNTYSVKLNDQELRNGRFFGRFKQTTYALALEHLEYWRNQRLFTEQAIARMLEVELVSELLIALIAGMQDKKKTIDDFYEEYDEQFPGRRQVVERFRAVIDVINECLPDGVSGTEFRRVPLYYSLFCAAAHRLYGLPGEAERGGGAGRLTRVEKEALRDAVHELSEVVESARAGERTPSSQEPFVTACLSQTDNIRPRRIRFEAIYRSAFR